MNGVRKAAFECPLLLSSFQRLGFVICKMETTTATGKNVWRMGREGSWDTTGACEWCLLPLPSSVLTGLLHKAMEPKLQ